MFYTQFQLFIFCATTEILSQTAVDAEVAWFLCVDSLQNGGLK